MSFEGLLIHTVTIGKYGFSESDEYGNAVPVWTDGGAVPARVQPDSTTEEEVNRDTTTIFFRVFLPAGTDVGTLDHITWEGDVYAVVGDPQIFSDAIGAHHVELQMRRFEGG